MLCVWGVRVNTGTHRGCEPPCLSWKPSSDLLQGQYMLSTTVVSLKPNMENMWISHYSKNKTTAGGRE